MKIYGGRAGYNSVSFTGSKYQSLSRLKDKEIITEVRMKKGNSKLTAILSKIPFVRSFSLLFEVVIDYWKRFLLALIVLFMVEVLLIGKTNSNSYLLQAIPISNLDVLCGLLGIAGLIVKITPIGKYHAAEHMVANAYVVDSNLTLEKVKKQPRIHKDCGTNLVTSIFICFSILFLVFGDAVWVLLVSWSIGYEIWKREPKVIWDLVLVIGKTVQYLLFTSKPREKHLNVAIEAIKRLEEKESGRI